MRTLTIEAVNADSAHALLRALSAFQATLVAADGHHHVQVGLGSNRETVAVLNTLAKHIAQRDAGPTSIELDGHTYLLDPPKSDESAYP